LVPQFTETYTLALLSQGGARLYLDDQKLIDDWNDHGATTDTAQVDLQAGHGYRLRIEYYASGAGGATARLSWSSAHQSLAVVPSSALEYDELVQQAKVTATLSANPNMVVSALVDAQITGASSAVVQYGPAGQTQQSPSLTVAPSGHVSYTLSNLAASTLIHAVVIGYDDTGHEVARSADLTLTTGDLPTDLPTIDIVQPGDFGGLLAIGTTGGHGFVVDSTGRVAWYAAMNGLGDFKRLSNGDFVLYDGAAGPTYDEVDLAGNLVRRWTNPVTPDGDDNHEFQLLPSGNALVLGAWNRVVDLSAYGGPAQATIYDVTIEEFAVDGTSVFHWSAFDHIPPDESSDPGHFDGLTGRIDLYHSNAVNKYGNNYLLSVRHTDTVYYIDGTTGNILWRLGGKSRSFQFVNDPQDGFSHQHYARFVGPADAALPHVLLFDNGNLPTQRTSRAVEYEIDAGAGTASLVWTFAHNPPIASSCCGGAERLTNGNTVVMFGPQSTISVVDPAGLTVWEGKVHTPGALMYRALYFPSLP
jgi:hypothetical protein